MGLVSSLLSGGYTVSLCSAATKTPYSEALLQHGVSKTFTCPANDATGFKTVLQEAPPAICIFDRFYIEEQFGWQVERNSPDCLRVIDTQVCYSCVPNSDQGCC